MRNKEYAVYKNEDIIYVGTMKEITKKLNVKRGTFYSWVTRTRQKANKKGILAYELELDDNEII